MYSEWTACKEIEDLQSNQGTEKVKR